MMLPEMQIGRRVSAQIRGAQSVRPCIGAAACQSVSQTKALSLSLSAAWKSRNPSPSSSRFQAFVPEPGLFSLLPTCNVNFLKLKQPFAFTAFLGNVATIKKVKRGSQACSIQKSFSGLLRLAYWRDANGEAPQNPRQMISKTALKLTLVKATFSQVRSLASLHFATQRIVTNQINAFAARFFAGRTHDVNTPICASRTGGFFVAKVRGALSRQDMNNGRDRTCLKRS